MIGYRGVRHEFVDDANIPRIAIEADDTVPVEIVAFLRSAIERAGLRLPPRESRAPLLGPRLVP